MPVRYIFAAVHKHNTQKRTSMEQDSNICHAGTMSMPAGIRVSMTMGDVNGMTENQNAICPSG